MRSFFIRGALLPFFFICSSISASDGMEKYFSVFYGDMNEYVKWYDLDKNDNFKDIFIELYNLPRPGKRQMDKNAGLKVLRSFSKNEEYGYLYLDIQKSSGFEAVIYGVMEGEVLVNGKSEGKLKAVSETGYSKLSGRFEKGVFFLVVKIIKKIENAPVIMLSNKDIARSAEKGFTKNGIYSLKVKNVESGISGKHFMELYKGFCFPYFNEADREKFFSAALKDKKAGISKRFLLGDIHNSIYNKKDREDLLKNGFSTVQLDWWMEKFNSGEVCRYE
ncbi:MAG TPA: hypothetical protein P5044_03815 [bacterium]|nr:hypothetical protein [bacterium]